MAEERLVGVSVAEQRQKPPAAGRAVVAVVLQGVKEPAVL